MRLTRLKTAALAVVAVALAAGGCSDANTLGVEPNLAQTSGAYALATVNGTPLPVEVRNDASMRVTITAGSLTVAADGTFQQSLTLSEQPATSSVGSARQSGAQGTVSISGDRIRFHASDGGEWEGTLGVNRIDYSVPANTGSTAFSFRR